MRITFDNNRLYYDKKSQSLYFEGKGTDLMNEWKNNSERPEYHKEIAHDLAEGSKLYFRKHKDIDNSVKNFYNNGNLTVIFDIPNNEILKVSLENPLEFRQHNPEFDIPFLTPVEKYGKTYIVKQPKASRKNFKNKHFYNVEKRIRRAGCELSIDGRIISQYGLYNGKPYLLDTRCAMPRPNAWTVFIDKICTKINRCHIDLNDEQSELEQQLSIKEKGYFAYHCDEIPRKSITFKEGISKLRNIIKNNIKYKKNNYKIPYEDLETLNLRDFYKNKYKELLYKLSRFNKQSFFLV